MKLITYCCNVVYNIVLGKKWIQTFVDFYVILIFALLIVISFLGDRVFSDSEDNIKLEYR